MLKIIVTIAIFAVFWLPFAQTLSTQPDKTKCFPNDKTEPKQLKGGFSRGDYDFLSLSDVEKMQEKNTFTRVLVNQHKTRILPAKWAEAKISFEEIDPNDCAKNSFESGASYKEKPKTKIQYGPRLDKEVEVSLYVPEAMDKQKTHNVLKSEIVFAKVDFRFTSTFKGDTIVYKVQNSGSAPEVHFKLEKLDESLKLPELSKNIKIDTNWPSSTIMDYKLLKGGDAKEMVISFAEKEFDAIENQVEVVLTTVSSREPIARGLVSVHIPKKRK